jgi:S1-C subfamily serine protease
MLSPIRRASTLAVFLGMTGLVTGADDTLSRESIAKRAKVATALLEVKPTYGGPFQAYGSAFCIHSTGLFVTNEHVVSPGAEFVTLVLNAGLKSQKVLMHPTEGIHPVATPGGGSGS